MASTFIQLNVTLCIVVLFDFHLTIHVQGKFHFIQLLGRWYRILFRTEANHETFK